MSNLGDRDERQSAASDDALLARLHAADPAADLPPLEPERLARLLEVTMSAEKPNHTAIPVPRSRWNRTALALGVAASLALVALVGGVLLNGGNEPTPAPAAAAVELQAPGDTGLVKCVLPSAANLRSAEIAFDGTVTEIDGRQVTLEVGHWYRGGGKAEQVTVTGQTEQMQMVLSAVELKQGGRYLISAIDDVVTVCGMSAPYSPEMAAMYDEAFGK